MQRQTVCGAVVFGSRYVQARADTGAFATGGLPPAEPPKRGSVRAARALRAARGLAPVPATPVVAAIEPGRSHLCFGELEGRLEEARVVKGRNDGIDVALPK